jgi:hypothetical protein
MPEPPWSASVKGKLQQEKISISSNTTSHVAQMAVRAKNKES